MAPILKKISLLCLLIVFSFISRSSAQYLIYTDSVRHYKVSIPDTWNFIPNYKSACFLTHRPVKYKGESKIENAVFIKIDDTASHTLEAAFTRSIFITQFKDTSLSIFEQGLSDTHAYRWYATVNAKQDIKDMIRNLTIVFFNHGQAYVLQCTASNHTYDDYKPIFLKIADSIKFQ